MKELNIKLNIKTRTCLILGSSKQSFSVARAPKPFGEESLAAEIHAELGLVQSGWELLRSHGLVLLSEFSIFSSRTVSTLNVAANEVSDTKDWSDTALRVAEAGLSPE